MEFVIWMLGYPIVYYVSDILSIVRRKLLKHDQLSMDEYKSAVKGAAILWLVVGMLLYIK